MGIVNESIKEIVKESIFVARTYYYDINFILREDTVCWHICKQSSSDGNPDNLLVKTGSYIEEVFRIGIPQPLLSVGDKFFREEEKVFYTVEEVVRTDKDNVCYVVENLSENIISEESQKKYDKEKSEYVDNECTKRKLNDV
ncbi:MAG: hypothetical protein RR322_06370, partial [Oscillospiraceae bacterium]